MSLSKTQAYSDLKDDGKIIVKDSFRDWIKADGSTPYLPETGRYHLYVAYICPYACICLAALHSKGLESVIGVTPVHWWLDPIKKWYFTNEYPDDVNHCDTLREIYLKADPTFNGRITVPVLWDKLTNQIVSNESVDIVRMLNSEFNEFCETKDQAMLNLYPEELRVEIDEFISGTLRKIYVGTPKLRMPNLEPDDQSISDMHYALEKIETILEKQRFLCGNVITEADVRLFVVPIKWAVCDFVCKDKRIRDYVNIWQHTRDVYNLYGMRKSTPDVEYIVKNNTYFLSDRSTNPDEITVRVPELDLSPPHERRKHFGVIDTV